MARVKLIQNKEDIAPEHYPLFTELAALRGRISGPSTIMLHSPTLARPWNEVGEYLHRQGIVAPQCAELAVSIAAREYDCAYVWAAHVPQARKAGVSEATFAAVADGGSVNGLPSAEAAVVNYVRQLLRDNRVDSAVFDPLLAVHGARWLVELTAWIGRYSALSFVLNTFEVLPAAGKEPLPERPPAAAAPRKSARAPFDSPRVALISSRNQAVQADPAAPAVFDTIADGRKSVRGPFAVLMHSPPLCQTVFDVSNCLRFASLLFPRTRELVTIITAREHDCPYVWASHAAAARREGVPDATIALVRDHGDTTHLAPDEADVVDFTRQLLRSHRVTQALFDRLHDTHGAPWLVELTALIGHYRVITATLNAFEVAPAAPSSATAASEPPLV
jgi:4-carboxymuconolactone decarboxylase